MKDSYINPLIQRYASQNMAYLFSPQFKFQTWRKLWILLAEAEKELGLPITNEQIDELKKFEKNINYDVAERKEKEVRHDVMAHVHAYGQQCPKAAGIIHLGATSCYVGDNTELIQIKEALRLVQQRLLSTINKLSQFALKYKSLPTLGFTHYQPAQLTTVGKRSCLWIQELLLDEENLEDLIRKLPFRGVKGTTGTQASFLSLFEGDHNKVSALDEVVTQKAGFTKKLTITGQTYSRKIDYMVLSVLSGIAQTLSKFSTDIRLLQNLKEIEEPFGSAQIGSSAMAYKRNPMRSERIGSLSRYVQSLSSSVAFTASTQWLERTLDDSANKRLAIPQAFLGVDAMLILAANVCNGMVVYPEMIHRRIMLELPFMATENILMACVKKGGNRQELHEKIRQHSMAAGEKVKLEGKDNDLLERIAQDISIGISKKEIEATLNPKNFTGRSEQLTEEFIKQEVLPLLESKPIWKALKDQQVRC